MASSVMGYDPSAKPTTEATAYTPDATKYHAPDPRQGTRGTMIPRAKPGGGSLGFSPEAGGVINIINTDNMDGEGGNPLIARVDIGRLNQDNVTDALRGAGSMEEAWASLATDRTPVPAALPIAVQVQPPTPNTHQALNPLKKGYVVPPSSVGGAQLPYDATSIVPAVSSVSPQPAVLSVPRSPYSQGAPVNAPLIPVPQPEPAAAISPPRPTAQVGGVAPQPVDPTQVMLAQIANGMNVLAQLVQNQQQTAPAVASQPIPAAPEPEPEPQADAFDSLQIPFLGRTPTKPTKQVFFNMGKNGKGKCWSHGYLVLEKVILLIHDDRWDQGSEWLPQESDEPILMTIPELSKTFRVYWSECLLPIGMIEIAMFIIAPDEREEREEREAPVPEIDIHDPEVIAQSQNPRHLPRPRLT